MGGDVRGRKRRDRPAVPIWTPAFAGEGNYEFAGGVIIFAGDGDFFAWETANFCGDKKKPFPRKRESRYGVCVVEGRANGR